MNKLLLIAAISALHFLPIFGSDYDFKSPKIQTVWEKYQKDLKLAEEKLVDYTKKEKTYQAKLIDNFNISMNAALTAAQQAKDEETAKTIQKVINKLKNEKILLTKTQFKSPQAKMAMKKLISGYESLKMKRRKYETTIDSTSQKTYEKTQNELNKALMSEEKKDNKELVAVLNQAIDEVEASIIKIKSKQIQEKAGQYAQVFSDGSDIRHYYLYLPKSYFKAKKPMPLMLFLHGLGEQGIKKHGADLEIIKNNGPTRFLDGKANFPFIVVSPQNPKAVGWWKPPVLSKLLDDVISKYNVDEDRVYCTGLSMGGIGTYAQAAHEPDRFAAILPIAGNSGGNQASIIASNKIPVWAFHGDQDTVVKFEDDKKIVEQIKAEGGNIKFTVYPGVKHNSWRKTYDNDKIYDWLLSHKLSDRKK